MSSEAFNLSRVANGRMFGKTTRMAKQSVQSRFEARLCRPAQLNGESAWAFLLLPKEVSETLLRRGRTSVEGTINGCPFQATLEPDGQLGHWMKLSEALQAAASVQVGDLLVVELSPVKCEPEPEVPIDFKAALESAPEAFRIWNATTSLARLDWIHWITTAKQLKTRAKRISDACDMLAAGKKRVCCFDPSGFYSKAFKAPQAID